MRSTSQHLSIIKTKLMHKARVSARMLFGFCLANLKYRFKGENYSTAGTVGLVVTDAGRDVAYGDYFTALELAAELEESGYKIVYLRRFAGDWYYEAAKCEIVISLLESFNPEKIVAQRTSRPYCIAWARNWFERWSEAQGIKYFDLLLASSETAADYMSDKLKSRVVVFPLATSQSRFSCTSGISDYQRDLCFTGSYWYKPRELERWLDISKISNYRFDVFGENWGSSQKFKPYWRGFQDYENLADIYKSTKIVLDDANLVTKPFGAVNSRVYDALASGALVLTNGRLGAEETFNGLLPTYSTSEELHQKIDFYLNNEEARLTRVAQLQNFVLQDHTYRTRVARLLELLKENRFPTAH